MVREMKGKTPSLVQEKLAKLRSGHASTIRFPSLTRTPTPRSPKGFGAVASMSRHRKKWGCWAWLTPSSYRMPMQKAACCSLVDSDHLRVRAHGIEAPGFAYVTRGSRSVGEIIAGRPDWEVLEPDEIRNRVEFIGIVHLPVVSTHQPGPGVSPPCEVAQLHHLGVLGLDRGEPVDCLAQGIGDRTGDVELGQPLLTSSMTKNGRPRSVVSASSTRAIIGVIDQSQGLPLGVEAGQDGAGIDARLDDLDGHERGEPARLLGDVDAAHAASPGRRRACTCRRGPSQCRRPGDSCCPHQREIRPSRVRRLFGAPARASVSAANACVAQTSNIRPLGALEQSLTRTRKLPPRGRRSGDGRRRSARYIIGRIDDLVVDDDRPFLDGVHAQDAALRRVEDRRRQQRAEDPAVGDRERAAGQSRRPRSSPRAPWPRTRRSPFRSRRTTADRRRAPPGPSARVSVLTATPMSK